MHNRIAASKLKSSLTRPSFFLHPSYHFLPPQTSHSIDHLCTQIHTHSLNSTPFSLLQYLLRHWTCHNNDKIPTHSSTVNSHKMGPGPIIYKEKTTSHLQTQPKTHSHVPFRTSLGLIEDRESQRGWVGGEKRKMPPWGRRLVEVELQSSRSGHGGSGLVRRESEV